MNEKPKPEKRQDEAKRPENARAQGSVVAKRITREQIVAAARSQLGVPWVHQGRMWGSALDCGGLVICLARQLGIVTADFDVTGYGRAPDGSMLRWCDRFMTRLAEMEDGAVLCVATEREPQHLGIVAPYVHGGGFSLVHATNAGRARVVESRIVFTRTLRLRAIYRFPGVA